MRKVILRTQREIDDFLDEIIVASPQYLALDIETDWFSDTKWSPLQLGLDWIWLYDWERACFIVHNEHLDYSGLNWLIHQVPLLTHNWKFDITVLLNLGYISELEWITIHDTKILSFLSDENKPSHSLKDLAISILKKSEVVRLDDVWQKPVMERTLLTLTKESQEEFRKDILEVWEDKLGSYCIDDCVNTYELFQYFKENMITPRIWAVYEKIELPFLKVLIEMEMRGIQIDSKYLVALGEKIKDRILELQIKIYQEAGTDFNVGSAKQIQEIFKKLSIDIPDKFKTAKWEVSTSVACLKFLASSYPIADLILEWREFTKLENGFIDSLISKSIKWNIHCSFNQTGTVSGRLSSSNPNLQNIPSRNDEFDIRKAFVAREGYSFVISDLWQAELRILAHFSQEKVLLDAFNSWSDIHQATADKLNVDRKAAKTINFWIIYWMSSYWLAESLGITRVKADEIIKSYFSELPKVEQFIKACYHTVNEKKFITTILWRHRNFPKYWVKPTYPLDATQEEKKAINLQWFKDKSAMERQIVNSTIQGSAADYIKLAMRNIQRDIKEYWATLLVSIHDEVLVECKDEHLEKVKEIVWACMKNAIKLNWVPVEISLVTSKCWIK